MPSGWRNEGWGWAGILESFYVGAEMAGRLPLAGMAVAFTELLRVRLHLVPGLLWRGIAIPTGLRMSGGWRNEGMGMWRRHPESLLGGQKCNPRLPLAGMAVALQSFIPAGRIASIPTTRQRLPSLRDYVQCPAAGGTRGGMGRHPGKLLVGEIGWKAALAGNGCRAWRGLPRGRDGLWQTRRWRTRRRG